MIAWFSATLYPPPTIVPRLPCTPTTLFVPKVGSREAKSSASTIPARSISSPVKTLISDSLLNRARPVRISTSRMIGSVMRRSMRVSLPSGALPWPPPNQP